VSSFIGFVNKAMPLFKNMIETLYLMLLKCYHHLHPLSENATIDQAVDEYCYLNIFEMTTSKNELTNELVSKELLIFRRFQVNVKDIKCLFQ
jgi:hypothetical protein